MDAFYSIIYYKPIAASDELVSIALLSGGGQGPFLYISNSRMNLLRKVLKPTVYQSLRKHLKGIKSKVDKHRSENNGLLLFDPVFSEKKLKELSTTSKGAIVYSEPTTINDWLDEKVFNRLILLFFNEEIEEKK